MGPLFKVPSKIRYPTIVFVSYLQVESAYRSARRSQTKTNDRFAIEDVAIYSFDFIIEIPVCIIHSSPQKSPVRVQVFNQPASLPFLTSAITGGGTVSDSFANIETYQSWLEAQRSGANQKIWLVKGGNLDYNYSSCDFKSTRGQSRAVVIGTVGTAAPTIKEIPRTIPGTLTLEIFTKNQLLKSGTVLEDRSCLQKSLPSDCKVEDVKNAVVKEIVAGIATTFQLDPTKVLTDENHFPINFDRIELLFQYFNPVISSWRAIASEVDWLHAKQLCMSHRERQTAQQGALSVRKPSVFDGNGSHTAALPDECR